MKSKAYFSFQNQINMNKQTLLFNILFLSLFIGKTAKCSSIIPLTKTNHPPKIDGILDDAEWQEATIYTDFKTIQPDFGLAPSEKTIAYLNYDHNNLYFAIHCYDEEPNSIKATLSARDQDNGDDWVALCVDADNDELGAFFFMVNPFGVQVDGTLDAAANPDIQLDLVWQSAANRTPTGYIVEMAIPFHNLRFPKKEILTMGFKIARFISRKSEEVDFPEYRPERGAALTQFQKSTVSDIKSKRGVEILPAVTLTKQDNHENGKMKTENWKPNIGLTTKLNLSSSLTLDATFNPDFSQVETDAGRVDVNLRAAPFYPEKRPFFQERQEWFGFSGRPDGTYLRQIVNTRNIVNPITGVKLSGKMGSKNFLSTLYALDEYPGTTGDTPNGKNAHFSVLRFGRLLTTDAYLGGFVTSWHFDKQYNYVGGTDGRIRLNNKSRLEFHGFGSVGKSDYLKQTGYAFGASWHFNTRLWNLTLGGFDISRDFDTKIGYVTRTGLTTIPIFAQRHFFFDHKKIQRISPYFWARQSRDHFSDRWETFNILGVSFAFPRQTEFSISTWLADEIFASKRFGRNAVRFEVESQPFNWLRVELEGRYGQGIFYDSANPYPGMETELGAGIRLQPISKISTTFSLTFSSFYENGNQNKVYDIAIWRNVTTFQFNKYLFFRAITEYNTYRKQLREDLLLSFTWIPGTVVYLGYGSQFDKVEWQEPVYISSEKFLNSQRTWYFKASYRWSNK